MIESIGPENLKWSLAALPFLVGLWLWRHDIPWVARLTKEDQQAQRIAALEARQDPVQVNVNIGEAIAEATKQPRTTSAPAPPKGATFDVARHIPSEGIVLIGTKRGPMTVRLNGKKTIADIIAILSKNDILKSLSDDYE